MGSVHIKHSIFIIKTYAQYNIIQKENRKEGKNNEHKPRKYKVRWLQLQCIWKSSGTLETVNVLQFI